MKFHEKEEHRIDQRLRRIEAQLNDITLMLEKTGVLTPADDESILREVLQELDAERNAIELSLSSNQAANDHSWEDG